MKLFNRKTKKLSKTNNFLVGLQNAVNLSKDKEEYQLRFRTIINKADDKKYQGKGIKNLNKALVNGLVEDKSAKPTINSDETSKDLLIKALISHSNKDTQHIENMGKINKLNAIVSKPITRFNKFKNKCKNYWNITKEFGNLIKCWCIVEYKIVRKLVYALDKKKNEVKVRVAFESNMHNMINMYGYDRGMKIFNDFTSFINNSVEFHKRMKKQNK